MKWPLVQVGEIASQHRGVSYSKEESRDRPTNGFTPIFRANNITDSGLTFEDLVYVPNSRISEVQRVRCGDIVIAASSGSLDVVGKAGQAIQDKDIAFGAFCKLIRPNSLVHPRYLGHFFKTKTYRQTVSALAAGANINNLRNEHIDHLELPLPPLEDQRRIAAILDQAEALRAKRRQALAKLDTLTQSLFLEMFGDPIDNPMSWDSKSLDELVDRITDGEHLNPPFSECGMPIVMAGNVLEDRVELSAAKKVALPLGEKFRRKCAPEHGDLLLVSRGATIGRLCTVQEEDPFCLMGSVILIKPMKTLVRSEYLREFLKLPSSRAALYQTSGSSAQQAIYLKDLKRMKCLLPPLDIQVKFEERMRMVLAVTRSNSFATALNGSLFDSLQARAFRGEL